MTVAYAPRLLIASYHGIAPGQRSGVGVGSGSSVGVAVAVGSGISVGVGVGSGAVVGATVVAVTPVAVASGWTIAMVEIGPGFGATAVIVAGTDCSDVDGVEVERAVGVGALVAVGRRLSGDGVAPMVGVSAGGVSRTGVLGCVGVGLGSVVAVGVGEDLGVGVGVGNSSGVPHPASMTPTSRQNAAARHLGTAKPERAIPQTPSAPHASLSSRHPSTNTHDGCGPAAVSCSCSHDGTFTSNIQARPNGGEPMAEPDPQLQDQFAAGYRSLAAAEWGDAFAHFHAVVQSRPSAEAYEGVAMAAWWLDDVAAVFAFRERAYRLYRERGDRLGAARCATWIGLDHYIYRAERAIASGWLQRANRLLDGLAPAAEHGWLAIWSGHIALFDDNDVETARHAGSETQALARSLDLPDLEALALALEGLAHVCEGQVDDGMRRLDEAATTAISGDVSDFDAIATICCYLIFACERVRDYDRAAEWCEKVEQVSLRCDYRSMFPVCRTHYAAVLLWRGDWQRAEAELSEAIRQLTSARRGWVTDSVVRLAELRRRQGRLDEAAVLFEQSAGDARSLLGLAELALDQRDAVTAADFVDRFLRRVPRDDRTERAVGLDLAVRVRIALGEVDRARDLLSELDETAALVGAQTHHAFVSLGRGRIAVAAGEIDLARRSFEDAVDLFERAGAPYETALSRFELARLLSADGRDRASVREADAARVTFMRLGAHPPIRQIDALLLDLAQSLPDGKSDPVGLTRRETEILRLLALGNSNQQIADALFISIRTVERHISTIYDKLGAAGVTARSVATAYAITHGIAPLQSR